jgi:transcriptional regulator with XRE-family HTH domain
MKYHRIRDLREDHDLTQTQMGKILSCSQRVYSNYERGELDIPTEILRKLALHYHVTTDYLLELSDERWPYAEQDIHGSLPF